MAHPFSLPKQERSRHLSERQLAQRWNTSQRTLQRWRAAGEGPPFLRLGGSIRYSLTDVLAFEENARMLGGRS